MQGDFRWDWDRGEERRWGGQCQARGQEADSSQESVTLIRQDRECGFRNRIGVWGDDTQNVFSFKQE